MKINQNISNKIQLMNDVRDMQDDLIQKINDRISSLMKEHEQESHKLHLLHQMKTQSFFHGLHKIHTA
ncbi:MAG: hypothetical protein JW769_00635 [Parachlamydiales bacterium]|nr:hypothetical protein [Parachlamydiales bacterium]